MFKQQKTEKQYVIVGRMENAWPVADRSSESQCILAKFLISWNQMKHCFGTKIRNEKLKARNPSKPLSPFRTNYSHAI